MSIIYTFNQIIEQVKNQRMFAHVENWEKKMAFPELNFFSIQ